MDSQILCSFCKSEKEFAKWFCKQRFVIFQFFASNPMEYFSKPRRQTTFVQQTKGLTSKKVALHVRYNYSWHIVLPSSEKEQRKMTKFWVNHDFEFFEFLFGTNYQLYFDLTIERSCQCWLAITDYSLLVGALWTAVHKNHFANHLANPGHKIQVGIS